jgi:hypothetical protein
MKLKDDGSATVDKPPNHTVFNALSTGNLAPKSLLQRRQQAASNLQGVPQASTQIHNHFSLPDSFFGLLSNTLPGPTNTPAIVSNSQMLLLIAQPSGPKLTIADFCRNYSLSDSICARLTENGYSGTHTFSYIEVGDLKEMGFKGGEIAELKHAVATWASS